MMEIKEMEINEMKEALNYRIGLYEEEIKKESSPMLIKVMQKYVGVNKNLLSLIDAEIARQTVTDEIRNGNFSTQAIGWYDTELSIRLRKVLIEIRDEYCLEDYIVCYPEGVFDLTKKGDKLVADLLTALQQMRTEPCEWCQYTDADEMISERLVGGHDTELLQDIKFCPNCGRRLPGEGE